MTVTERPTMTMTVRPTLIEQEEEDVAAVVNELEHLGIASEYRVSLAWESKADLDIYVENLETGETVNYKSRERDDGNTKLDADNTGGNMREGETKHLENISFNGPAGGSFAIYVNNHHANGDEDEIPFAVVTKVGRETQVFEDSWDINERGEVRDDDLYKMMPITIIEWEG